MGAGPYAVVQAPPARPPRVGLLVSADPPTDEDARWQNGFSYDPEGGSLGYITDSCAPGAQDRALDDDGAEAAWEPYVVGAGVRCSALGANTADMQARARRALEATAEYQISRELWTGAWAQANGHANRWLADVATVDILTEDGAVGLVHGLACLEAYLQDCNAGERGMIHATRQTVVHWATLSLLRREGGTIFTINDTLIVPGAGYDGTDPNGGVGDGNVWAYATDMVQVRRGPVTVYGAEEPNRATNVFEVRAEQLAVASWSGHCLGGVRLDLDWCGVGGS